MPTQRGRRGAYTRKSREDLWAEVGGMTEMGLVDV